MLVVSITGASVVSELVRVIIVGVVRVDVEICSVVDVDDLIDELSFPCDFSIGLF